MFFVGLADLGKGVLVLVKMGNENEINEKIIYTCSERQSECVSCLATNWSSRVLNVVV